MNREDGQVCSVCILQVFVLLSTTVCSQNINKQNVNIADETLTDNSFLSRFHYPKSKNSLKRRYWIRHWIPMFIGTPCTTLAQGNMTKTQDKNCLNLESKFCFLLYLWTEGFPFSEHFLRRHQDSVRSQDPSQLTV